MKMFVCFLKLYWKLVRMPMTEEEKAEFQTFRF